MNLLNKLKFWDNSVNLTAYTDSKEIAENSPPLLNKQKNPWFLKTIPTGGQPNPVSQIVRPPASVLGCPGIRQHLSNGIHIKMWSDLIVKIWPDGKYTYMFPESAMHNNVMSHDRSQFGELYPKDRISIKLDNPWRFVTDKSVKFIMTDSHYATPFFRENDLWVPPGISDFSKQTSTNIHIVCPIRSEPYELYFKYGQPLVTFYPMFERKINIDIKVISTGDMMQLTTLPSTFRNKYYKK